MQSTTCDITSNLEVGQKVAGKKTSLIAYTDNYFFFGTGSVGMYFLLSWTKFQLFTRHYTQITSGLMIKTGHIYILNEMHESAHKVVNHTRHSYKNNAQEC